MLSCARAWSMPGASCWLAMLGPRRPQLGQPQCLPTEVYSAKQQGLTRDLSCPACSDSWARRFCSPFTNATSSVSCRAGEVLGETTSHNFLFYIIRLRASCSVWNPLALTPVALDSCSP